MRLMELETSGFRIQSSCSPDYDHVLTNMKSTLLILEFYLQGVKSQGLPIFLHNNNLRVLYKELLHLKSCYHHLILSWIGDNFSECQQLWDVLLNETLTSLQMAESSFSEYQQLWDVLFTDTLTSLQMAESSFSSVYQGDASNVASHHKACSTIRRILICYMISSSFRVCFHHKSFSADQMKICLQMLHEMVEPFTLYSISENQCVQQHFKFTNSRLIQFMESVIRSPQYDTLLKMRDENQIPTDLLADIEVVLSKASEAMVTCLLASSSRYSESVNTSLRFISIAIYTHVRIIEETAVPTQYQRGCSSLSWIVATGMKFWDSIVPSQHQQGDPSLSWIDAIGLKFWDSILESMQELLKQSSCPVVQWKDKNEVLQNHLIFIKYFLTGPPVGFIRKGNWNDFSDTIKVTISRQVTTMFRSCYYSNNYDQFRKDAKKELRKTIRLIYSFDRETLTHCPRIGNEFESLDYFFRKTEILITHLMISSHQNVKKQRLVKAQEDLTSLIVSLDKISDERIESEELNSLCRQIGDVACAIGYIVHSLLYGSCPDLYLKLWFSDFEKETNLIRVNINSISEKNRSTNQDHDVTRLSNYKSSIIIDEEIVGFVDEEMKVVEHIVAGSEDMSVVLISGMPGLGKTTLAKRVYNNRTVAEHFYVRSWCCVSHRYQKKDLLVQILKHIKPLEEDMDEYRLAEMLRKELMQRRYLIVMDDIWDITAWDDLRRCFPDDRNGSRILLTSRSNDIPLHPKAKIHFLNPLSDDESWALLQKKLHFRENWPSELLETGDRIAKGCKGVPLVVVLVAGLLADMNLDQWQKVACNVTSYVVNDSQRQCADILEMSYKNLPNYLKPCLLYLGCFPPDYEISSKKLIQLWIAEGFIRTRVASNVECIAEGYLMDLIQRNLIQVAERRSLGSIKTCRVHDLIHDFCSSKGKEENFVRRISDASGAASKQTLRLSILYDWDHVSFDWSSYMNVCSLSFYSNIQNDSSNYIFEKFQFLTVLNLMSPILMWDIIDLPDAIGLLVHLRFLAGPFSSIPSSIGNLTNLVTFHMVVLQTDTIDLPRSFNSLVMLRHLHISCATMFPTPHTDLVPPFLNLQTLSTLLLPAYGDNVLTLFPSLRNLKCLFVNRQQRIAHPKFNILTQLESLEMTYLLGDWDETLPLRHINWEFSFPPCIRKLTLKMFCLPWSDMSIIAKLPNLEVLRLDRSAFVGIEWDMGDYVFHKLKYLRLRGLNIIRWNASHDHFPRLENLVVQGCEYLEEIPTDFGNILTLRTIEVSGCKFSVEASAREIYEEQVEYGNEELKILARDNDPNNTHIWNGTVRRKLASELL